MGGGAFHPRRKRQAGGWEQGRACTQGQGHRAGWPEARLGKGTTGVSMHLEQLWCCSWQARGWKPKNNSILYPPSRIQSTFRRGRVFERVGRQGHLASPCIFLRALLRA